MADKAITFRENVRPDDVTRVRELAQSTGFFSESETDIAVELVETRLKEGVSSGYHFLFADLPDGLTAGYTCFGEIPCTVGSYDLYWIIVHRDHKSAGIGRQLMARTETIVKNMGGRGLYAETAGRSQYLPTRIFYQKIGYQTVATLKDFYTPGEDKVVFCKKLDSTPPG